MAAHSNRSPSPLSSRPINPNPKSSDSNSGPRRSFTGTPYSRPSVHTLPRNLYPCTPANSPSDFARRRSVGSVGKEGIFAFNDEKENDERIDHELKVVKIRSSSKNFMSPTISAASKFTPSPRKKVLIERNDPVRTSISLSDGKAMFFSANSEDVDLKPDVESNRDKVLEGSLDSEVSDKVVVEDPPVSKPLKRVTFVEVQQQHPLDSENTFESMSDTVVIDSDCFDENKVNCSSESPVIAPLDADPLMPPYDPKTNYLSPRPMFLHYKPNPRVEILMNKGKKGLDSDGLKKLEDSILSEIMSGSNSDSYETDESSQKEESEDVSSTDLVVGVDEKELEANVVISEERVEVKSERKSRVFSTFKCFLSLLLVFLIGSVCVSLWANELPVAHTSRLKDLSFTNLYHQSQAVAFTKVNLDGFVRGVNQYSVNSMSYISKVIADFGREDKLGNLQFMNLTDLQKETVIADQFMNKQLVEEFEKDEVEENLDTEFEEVEVEDSADVDSDEITEVETEEVSNMFEEYEMEEQLESLEFEIIEEEIEEPEIKNQENIGSEEDKAEVVSYLNTEETKKDAILEDQPAIDSSHHETQAEAEADIIEPEPEVTESGNNLDSCTKADLMLFVHESSSEVEGPQLVEESTPSTPSEVAHKTASYFVGVSCLFVAALLAAAKAFVYLNGRTSSTSSSVVVPCNDVPLLSKKKTTSELADAEKDVNQESPYSQNWTMIGESTLCPSEMSSFEKNLSSQSKRRASLTEAQSQERKARKMAKRESMASSSSEFSSSTSYGSFTTYERIPIKKVNGEEEIITPVRRSSRLRNHVTSP